MPPRVDSFSDHGGEPLRPQAAFEAVALDDSVGPMAFDGDLLVWSTDAGIFRKAKTGSEQLSTERASLLTLRGNQIAWVGRPDPSSPGFEVWKGTVSDTGLEKTARLARGVCSPRGLVADTEHVYFTGLCDGIVRVAWSGGRPETILPHSLDEPVENITLAGDNLGVAGKKPYWSTEGGIFTTSTQGPVAVVKAKDISAFVVEGSELIWADDASGHDVVPPTGALRRMALGGGPITTLAERQIQVVAIKTTPSYVVWRTEVGAIRRVRRDGTGLTTLRETGCWGYGLEGGPRHLYFEALLKHGVGRKCRPGIYEILIP